MNDKYIDLFTTLWSLHTKINKIIKIDKLCQINKYDMIFNWNYVNVTKFQLIKKKSNNIKYMVVTLTRFQFHIINIVSSLKLILHYLFI